MTEQQKEARREYKRRWAQSHPEKNREYQERFYMKKAQAYAAECADAAKDKGEN